MRGRTYSNIVKLAIALTVVSACGSTATSTATLADYAAGRWNCQFTVSGTPISIPPVTVPATVTATSATSGRVHLTFPPDSFGSGAGLNKPTKMTGQWQLRSGTLLVAWDDKSAGTVAAQPIALDTTSFKIRGGTPVQPGDWLQVRVNRQARSVTFAITTPGPETGHLTCTKA